MKILQLSSDWKWTGPAAPMLHLLEAQRERGDEVELVCAEVPHDSEAAISLPAAARQRGIPPVLTLEPARGVHPWRDTRDARRLRALVEARGFDVIHTWHTRDHALALRAAGRRRRAGRTRVVRSYKIADPIPANPWNRWLFGPGTDGLVCVSEAAARANERLRGGRPTIAAFGAVDVEHFRPAPPDEAVRESLGLESQSSGPPKVVGIVARAQRHRRFELLLEAMVRLAKTDSAARLLVVGRGTHIQETAIGPATRLGIADRVVFAGYRTGDYADVLRSMDVFTFLVPGSDGGCRALLEAAACGIPAVTTRRGALSEIVVDGETGILVEERAEDLVAAWRTLLDDPARRARMGEAARVRAEAHFTPARLAADVGRLYAAIGAAG